jgi:hypothetical protein
MSFSHVEASSADEANASSEDRLWSLIAKILTAENAVRRESLRARIAAHRLVKALALKPGLAEARLQKQLCKEAARFRRVKARWAGTTGHNDTHSHARTTVVQVAPPPPCAMNDRQI